MWASTPIIVPGSIIYYNSSHFRKSSFSSLSGEIYTFPAFPADFLKTTLFLAFPASGHPGCLKYQQQIMYLAKNVKFKDQKFSTGFEKVLGDTK